MTQGSMSPSGSGSNEPPAEAGRGAGCQTVVIATAMAVLVAWLAWELVLSPVWEDFGRWLAKTLGPGGFWLVFLAMMALNITVSSYVAARVTGYGRRSRPAPGAPSARDDVAPPAPSERRAPAPPAPHAPEPGAREPNVDTTGAGLRGPAAREVAGVAGATALVVLVLFGVGACAVIAIMTNAMCGPGFCN